MMNSNHYQQTIKKEAPQAAGRGGLRPSPMAAMDDSFDMLEQAIDDAPAERSAH